MGELTLLTYYWRENTLTPTFRRMWGYYCSRSNHFKGNWVMELFDLDLCNHGLCQRNQLWIKFHCSALVLDVHRGSWFWTHEHDHSQKQQFNRTFLEMCSYCIAVNMTGFHVSLFILACSLVEVFILSNHNLKLQLVSLDEGPLRYLHYVADSLTCVCRSPQCLPVALHCPYIHGL